MSRLSEVVWADILGHLREHEPSLVHPSFGRLEAWDVEGGVLTIRVDDPALLDHLQRYCKAAFTAAAQAVTGYLVAVRFVLADPVQQLHTRPSLSPSLRFNQDYVFDHFVTGPENRLAHASCRAVAEAPGKAYNPLFIHGSSGLGKTHLLQAICHQVLASNPRTRVAYLTCETFVNHFIEAVERGELYEFRHRYRDADLLVVDDIQFLTDRERSEDEFFHTFNTLYQSQRQIVLSADCAPAEIAGLAERLVSRFQWGLVARIDPLCVETRIAILRSKARMRQWCVPEDVLDFIGMNVRGNARELEGTLARIRAYADAHQVQITLDLARRILSGDAATGGKAPEVNLQRILSAVTERFQVKLSDLRGKRRHRSIVTARHACMFLARQMTDHSLEEIGAYFGGRDHSTVLHAQRTIRIRCEQDQEFRGIMTEIQQQLRQS